MERLEGDLRQRTAGLRGIDDAGDSETGAALAQSLETDGVLFAGSEANARLVAASLASTPDKVLRTIASGCAAALVLDAQNDERFAAAESILSSGVRSLIHPRFLILSAMAAVRARAGDSLSSLTSNAMLSARSVRKPALSNQPW